MTIASRRYLYSSADLEPLVAPTSIAVVGASATPGSLAAKTLANLAAADLEVPPYLVNPKYREIGGETCYESVGDLPQVPDLCILAVPERAVFNYIEEAAGVGVKAALIYASGFAELGTPESIERERQLAKVACRSGMRISGPNTLGNINFARNLHMHFLPRTDADTPSPEAGRIGLVSQSGALGYIVGQGHRRGLKFSHYLTSGNSCDVDILDYVNFLVDDPDTRAIGLIFEGLHEGGGARLYEVAQRARQAGKPVVAYKTGSSRAGEMAALSHTGSIVGSAQVYEAVFHHVGFIPVNSYDEFTETLAFMSKVSGPAVVPGVGVLASSGGAAVMAADEAERAEIVLPTPDVRTNEFLSTVVPAFGSVANPADITADAVRDPKMYQDCIRAFADDPNYGAVVVPLTVVDEAISLPRAALIAEVAAEVGVPIVVVWLSEWLEGPGSQVFESDSNVALFRSMARCMRALHRWQRWSQPRQAPQPLLAGRPAPGDELGPPITAQLEGTESQITLDEYASKKLLHKVGISLPAVSLAEDADRAVETAECIGYPVVLKIVSPDILHKNDVGGVKLGLTTSHEVREAFAATLAEVADRVPDATVQGVLVEPMYEADVEVMVSVKRDPEFGIVVVFAIGGLFVEILAESAVTVGPMDHVTAQSWIEGTRFAALLTGARGTPPVDVPALAGLIEQLCLVMQSDPRMREIELNPVMLRRGGHGLAIGDAMVTLAQAQLSEPN